MKIYNFLCVGFIHLFIKGKEKKEKWDGRKKSENERATERKKNILRIAENVL